MRRIETGITEGVSPPVQAVRRTAGTAGKHAGFTLIETALVTVIVGTAVLAIVSAQQAFHQQNNISQRMGTALLLANEIREMTLGLPQHDPISGTATWGPEGNELTLANFDDLDDFDGDEGTGMTFSPPVNALRLEIPNMEGWSQVVTVENVDPAFISAGTPAPDNTTEVVRFTCRVLFQGPNDTGGSEITRMTWVKAGGP